jgi:hypothetical protein
MIEAALKWLENGYWPIPISPLVTGGKKPLGGTDWGGAIAPVPTITQPLRSFSGL